MAGHRVLSTGDIAKKTGLSRQRVWQLAVKGLIPAKRANPDGKQYRFYYSAELDAWMRKKAREMTSRPVRQPTPPVLPPRSKLPWINDFNKWDYAVRTGKAKMPNVDTMWRDFEPMLRSMVKRLGKEWFARLIK